MSLTEWWNFLWCRLGMGTGWPGHCHNCLIGLLLSQTALLQGLRSSPGRRKLLPSDFRLLSVVCVLCGSMGVGFIEDTIIWETVKTTLQVRRWTTFPTTKYLWRRQRFYVVLNILKWGFWSSSWLIYYVGRRYHKSSDHFSMFRNVLKIWVSRRYLDDNLLLPSIFYSDVDLGSSCLFQWLGNVYENISI